MKDVLTIILLLIALCCLIAMPQTLRNKKGDKYVITYLWKGKRKIFVYSSFMSAYWRRGLLNMVEWIFIAN